MKPAYHISLTAPEKRLVAELAAIQSQIEWLMQVTIESLLGVKFETARQILGSTNLSNNADIWIRAVREKHPYQDEVVPWAEWAFSEMAHMAKGRNDFLHTLFGYIDDDTSGVWFSWGHTAKPSQESRKRAAIRVKNAAVTQIGDLKFVRDRAAYLSIAIAHVEWTADEDNDGSPWLRRLGGPLPPPKGETGRDKATRR